MRRRRPPPDPPRHKHDGPPVEVQEVTTYPSGTEDTKKAIPISRETRVLRRCLSCGSAFVTKLEGNWTLEMIQEAEGTKIRIKAVPDGHR